MRSEVRRGVEKEQKINHQPSCRDHNNRGVQSTYCLLCISAGATLWIFSPPFHTFFAFMIFCSGRRRCVISLIVVINIITQGWVISCSCQWHGIGL
jgi:hypothetical protein